MKVHDISLEIYEGMITYPGNADFRRRVVDKITGGSSNLSEYTLGAHTGTHVDGRRHVDRSGGGVETIPLDRCIGECRVVDLGYLDFGEGIGEEELAAEKIEKGEIVLFKTKNSTTGYGDFREDFIYLTDEGAGLLVRKKMKAVGTDYLSIQRYHSGRCAAHCILLEEGIPIFEGLDLSRVEAGRYLFIGFPLKIRDGDGSPVRAVLVEGLL